MGYDPREGPQDFASWANSLGANSAEERIVMGRAAQRLLNDSVAKNLLATIEAQVLLQWTICPLEDTERQHALKIEHRAVASFRKSLESYVEEGRLEEQKIEPS